MTDSITDPHKLLLRVALIHTASKDQPGTVEIWANGGNHTAKLPSVQHFTPKHSHTSEFKCDAIYGSGLPGYAMLVGMNMTEQDVVRGLKSVYPGNEFSIVQMANCALDNSNPRHAFGFIAESIAKRVARNLLPLTPITSEHVEASISVEAYKDKQPSSQPNIPFKYAPRLGILEAAARRGLKQKLKLPVIDHGEPRVAMYPGSSDTKAETQTGNITNAPPAYIYFELEVNVDYDPETTTFSARLALEASGVPSEDDQAALKAIEIVNQKLKLDSLLVAKGTFKGSDLPVESPVVPPIRPPETTKGNRKTEYDSWWTGVIKSYESLLTIDQTGKSSEFSKWLSKNPTSNLQSYKTTVAAEAGKSSWEKVASKLLTVASGAAGNVWETITTWGPKEMIGAYGGFTAIQKAKELPPWVWAVGAGVVALVLLKQ